MSKWTMVTERATKLTTAEVSKTDKAANRILKSVKRLSTEELKKTSDASYAAKVAREDSILAAYADKKLKSKALIKEAKAIKASRDKAAKKAEAKKQKDTKVND